MEKEPIFIPKVEVKIDNAIDEIVEQDTENEEIVETTSMENIQSAATSQETYVDVRGGVHFTREDAVAANKAYYEA